MDEIEIISVKENKEKVEKLSIEELVEYKKELLDMTHFVEAEIKKRKNERNNAEKFFKK